MQLIHYRKSVPNFGDDLNVDLWPALAPKLFDEDPVVGFVGIGTIIGFDAGPAERLEVFSSGAGYDPIGNWAGKQVRYHCVRGPVSARLLGLDADRALTDGAILTPLAPKFPDKARGGGGTIVIPHFQTLAYPGWPEVMEQTGYKLVDPRHDPATVIEQIASAELVLTESLHGAILADTYGIPWVAFATSGNFGASKWVDWTASLHLPLEFTVVPTPDPQPLIAFGRRPEGFGKRVRLSLEDALREFEAKTAPPPPRRNWLKERLKASPLVRRMLGFHPSRTAEALEALARGPAMLSAEPIRDRLRNQMMERLDALTKEYSRGRMSPAAS